MNLRNLRLRVQLLGFGRKTPQNSRLRAQTSGPLVSSFVYFELKPKVMEGLGFRGLGFRGLGFREEEAYSPASGWYLRLFSDPGALQDEYIAALV